MVKWEMIEENKSYIGDAYNINHRRVVVLLNEGIAVLAECDIEKYYLMKDDLFANDSDVSYQLLARIHNGLLQFVNETEKEFDAETLQEIGEYLYKTI